MKTLLISTILFASITAHAGNTPGGINDGNKKEIKSQVNEIVTDNILVESLGLTGEANVRLTVDDNNRIHVVSIKANDYLSEYHIKQSLEGVFMQAKESLIGKTFAVVIDFVQSK
ncbi:MAG: hypothetical protein IPG60_14515 [Bacteroidetes bacterium]|nr:hypothetical protein [Bacteroidota bacterium]MBP7398321.1 hypothetical protein [Chitinophagales bacterium]MBK7110164.1 hypothetical protein [Bacteroidota bacterium]MBK8487109.1 hypothetical protein [Bacteroidota bacterium]MBK8680495.1 hypothetical protein [Bacteroidota bacterium]